MIDLKTIKRLIALMMSVVLLVSLFSCGKKKETDDRTPYEKTIPASVSDSAGIGRAGYVPPLTQQEDTGRVVVVDPGHGFWDGGCGEGVYSDGTLEKDINLAVAEKLEKRLGLLGYTVILTHNGKDIPAADTNQNNRFSATERVAYINSLRDIDYVISIHVNSFDDDSISGMNIYYQQSNAKINTWGADVAASISSAIGEALGESSAPKIKDGTDPNSSFALSRDVKYASSLLEVGFVTNPEDAKNMVDPVWQETLANAIADGIDAFFKGDNNG